MKYISILNPFAIYHLWQDNYGKKYLSKLINSILKQNNKYELLNFYNKNYNLVRSYVIFESNNSIVFLDFNISDKKYNDDLSIINFLKVTNNKEIYFIIFNNYYGINYAKNSIYYIFKSNNILFADSFYEQYKLDSKITKILYSMSNELLDLYLYEDMIIKLLD